MENYVKNFVSNYIGDKALIVIYLMILSHLQDIYTDTDNGTENDTDNGTENDTDNGTATDTENGTATATENNNDMTKKTMSLIVTVTVEMTMMMKMTSVVTVSDNNFVVTVMIV